MEVSTRYTTADIVLEIDGTITSGISYAIKHNAVSFRFDCISSRTVLQSGRKVHTCTRMATLLYFQFRSTSQRNFIFSKLFHIDKLMYTSMLQYVLTNLIVFYVVIYIV